MLLCIFMNKIHRFRQNTEGVAAKENFALLAAFGKNNYLSICENKTFQVLQNLKVEHFKQTQHQNLLTNRTFKVFLDLESFS